MSRTDLNIAIKERQAVILYGNPAAGFNVVGPFKNNTDALVYGDKYLDAEGTDWWILFLEAVIEVNNDQS